MKWMLIAALVAVGCGPSPEQRVCDRWVAAQYDHRSTGSVCVVSQGSLACSASAATCTAPATSPLGICATACAANDDCGQNSACVSGYCYARCLTAGDQCGVDTFCVAVPGANICLPPNCTNL